MVNRLIKAIQAESEFEACVRCGEPTDVRRDTPVDMRMHYVEGAGQSCPECYGKAYPENRKRREKTELTMYFGEMGISLDVSLN